MNLRKIKCFLPIEHVSLRIDPTELVSHLARRPPLSKADIPEDC